MLESVSRCFWLEMTINTREARSSNTRHTNRICRATASLSQSATSHKEVQEVKLKVSVTSNVFNVSCLGRSFYSTSFFLCTDSTRTGLSNPSQRQRSRVDETGHATKDEGVSRVQPTGTRFYKCFWKLFSQSHWRRLAKVQWFLPTLQDHNFRSAQQICFFGHRLKIFFEMTEKT